MNKYKLTPCRQMGLPRRKLGAMRNIVQPFSSERKSPFEKQPELQSTKETTPQNQVTPPKIPETTPQNQVTVPQNPEIPSQNPETLPQNQQTNSDLTIKTAPISINDEDVQEHQSEETKVNTVEQVKYVNSENTCDSILKEDCTEDSSKIEIKNKLPKIQKIEVEKENLCDNEIIRLNFKKTFLKSSSKLFNDDIDDFQSMKKRKLKRLHSDTPKSSCHVKKLLKRSLTENIPTEHCSVIRVDYPEKEKKSNQHSSDDDFEEEPVVKKKKKCSSNDIKVLEKKLKDRTSHLDDLKRSKLIKNKHPVGELRETIVKWKNGCKNALNDLLYHLNGQFPAENMDMLLEKLGIPSDCVPLSQ